MLAAPQPAAASNPIVAVPALSARPSSLDLSSADWSSAATISLDYDYTYHRQASEATSVEIAQDGAHLDIAFNVSQRETLTDSQTTNGPNVLADDYVGVYLWPNGSNSFAYAFFANPRGTRYQTSSENSAYAPQWTTSARKTICGYVVTLRIPLDIMRSAGSTSWQAQFVRSTVATGGLVVWTLSPNSSIPNDVTSAGLLTHVGENAPALRPQARAQIYGLVAATSADNGGSTSRVGGDLSLPITPTASFVASFHPDFSNVELDQQTIAPNPYAYQYQEVRPFFTQAAQAFNQSTGCSNCPQLLYTPAIPTFQDAYAIEGTQGPLTFSAFDAIGDGRSDQGQTVDYLSQDTARTLTLDFQHQGVDIANGLHDEMSAYAASYLWTPVHLGVFSMGGIERGSNVTFPSQGNYTQTGVFYQTSTKYLNIAYQSLGSQFNPVDAYVPQTDITGYSAYGVDTINYSPGSMLHDIQATANYSEYHKRFNKFDQYLLAATLNFDFKNLTTIRLAGGAQNIRTFADEMLPFDSNSVELGYKVSTATPTYVQYATGPYYHGRLDEWTYDTTEAVSKRLSLTLQVEQNDYLGQAFGEPRAVQWLEQAALNYQISGGASIDVGVRRIIGTTAPNAIALPTFAYVNASNVTIAYHVLTAKNEIYIVYGDANSLYTTPTLYLKWIRYIGAAKGT